MLLILFAKKFDWSGSYFYWTNFTYLKQFFEFFITKFYTITSYVKQVS